MNRTKRLGARVGIAFGGALIGALTGCTNFQEAPRDGGTYYEPSGQAEGSYAEIRTESDFYEPLSPYGRWEVVGSYGRCWIPGGVEAGWSPYSNGDWEQTDAGWYWASDEPWGWATYHYGRWDSSPQYGWFWVPQTQWAPAWVSWRQGGGYVGWAPLGSSMRAEDRDGPSHGYVFVEERRFLDPVRSKAVIGNNTVFNRTANLTRTHVVNRTELNEGPGAAVIEQASGRKIQAAPVRELRTREEAKVVTKPRTPPSTRTQNVQAPIRNQAPAPEKRVIPAHGPTQVERPVSTSAESHQPAVKREVPPAEQSRVAKPAREQRVQPQRDSPKVVPLPPSGNSKPEVARRAETQGQNQPKVVEKRPEQPAQRTEKPDQNPPPTAEQHANPERAAGEQGRKNGAKDNQQPKDEN
jgi:hypothetical protein